MRYATVQIVIILAVVTVAVVAIYAIPPRPRFEVGQPVTYCGDSPAKVIARRCVYTDNYWPPRWRWEYVVLGAGATEYTVGDWDGGSAMIRPR